MKEAQDAYVFHTSQSALLGGDNPELNFETIDSVNLPSKKAKLDEAS